MIGYKIIINDFVCKYQEMVQVKFPKSKKKRIRKKWAKRPENWELKTFHRVIKADHINILFVSTEIYNELMKQHKNSSRLTSAQFYFGALSYGISSTIGDKISF